MPTLNQRRLLLSGRPISAPAPPSSLFNDAFAGINDTPLASHTPNVGGPWSDGVGFVLSDGSLVRSDPGGYSSVAGTNSAGASNYTLTVEYTAAGDDLGLAIYFRLTSINECWTMLWDTGTWYLQDVVGGIPDAVTQHFSTSYFYFGQPGVTFTFKLVLSGTSISFYGNDVLILSWTSSVRQTATGIGLDNYGGGGQFDNLLVVA